MNVGKTERDALTKLHQGVYGPHSTKQSRQLVLLNIIEPFINGIRKELIYTQQSAEKVSRSQSNSVIKQHIFNYYNSR